MCSLPKVTVVSMSAGLLWLKSVWTVGRRRGGGGCPEEEGEDRCCCKLDSEIDSCNVSIDIVIFIYTR